MKNNKEVSSSLNDQVHPHQEGQQQNISSGNARDNNSREVQEMNGGREGVNNTTENAGRERSGEGESESERANKNEDEGIRGGQSGV